VAGFLSMLNDFQVSPDGGTIYIAEASPIRQTPAIIVYDVASRTSRRLLDGHPSLLPQGYVIQAPGRDMIVFGFYTLHIGIDTIALDRTGEWLYYGPVNGARLYRVASAALRDRMLDEAALAARVEDFGPKPISDGATTDDTGAVYLTDPEHSAVHAIDADRRLRTVVKDERLRWPDGLSFGPDGWLYVTCSALHYVLFVSNATMQEHAPYQIYRFKPGPQAAAGH
jgi:sugar lactone lactonase YvrE